MMVILRSFEVNILRFIMSPLTLNDIRISRYSRNRTNIFLRSHGKLEHFGTYVHEQGLQPSLG